LVFDHLPPATTWIGAPIVIAAGLIIAWREHVLARARATGPVIA
jgi:drug/metabolite transporter (DMT)-like permease